MARTTGPGRPTLLRAVLAAAALVFLFALLAVAFALPPGEWLAALDDAGVAAVVGLTALTALITVTVGLVLYRATLGGRTDRDSLRRIPSAHARGDVGEDERERRDHR
jgi:ABC-type phosphonate transport system ATPase subunit